MRFKGILILAICFGSCKQKQPKVTLFKTKDFVVADTDIQANQFLNYDDYKSDYPIYYIGWEPDTIKIGKCYWRGRTNWVNDYKTPRSWTHAENNLRILVDTSIKTNSPVEYFSKDLKEVEDSTINYHSFLVSIKNISDSAVFLGRTFCVYFINREAKDRSGNWIKVDKKLSEVGLCLTGEPIIILKPNEIAIAKMKRYKGSFVTDFRLVFGRGNNIIYSNVFRDSIDERTLQRIAAQNQ